MQQEPAVRMVKMPKTVYVEISRDEFLAECGKHLPKSWPKYEMREIVNVKGGAFGYIMPAMIVGVESRSGEGWHYTVLRPRHVDGVIERVSVREAEIVRIEA